MSADEIRELFNFNDWANKKYIEAVQNLDDEKYTVEIRSSFSSIRETISHLIASEWIWLQRWLGESPTAPPDWHDKPSIRTLVEKMKDIESERENFLEELKDDDLKRVMNYNLLSGKAQQNTLQETLQHVVNHSTYHRGQLATLLRQIDETPPSTDLILYFRERRGMT
jgi:uncharacterized damage-inducible protein DinB